MFERPAYAPGCYGKTFAFSKDAVCGACPFSSTCEEARDRALAQMKQHYGVATPSRKADTLPVKVDKVFKALGKTEEEVKNAMLQGVNPYRVTDGPVGIVAALVLRYGEVPRTTLTAAVGRFRNVNEDTAAVYTRYAIQILAHCKAIIVKDDKIALACG